MQALTPKGQHMICVNKIRGVLAWITFWLGSQQVGLQLIIPATTLDFTLLGITTDAFPWGMGAALASHGQTISWFRAAVTKQDTAVLGGRAGEPGFNTAWELSCIHIAIRVWASEPDTCYRITLRSDALSSLGAISRLNAHARTLAKTTCELAIHQTTVLCLLDFLEHISGLANKMADLLSRRVDPAPAAPPDMNPEIEHPLPTRDSEWWYTGQVPLSGLYHHSVQSVLCGSYLHVPL